MEMKYIKIYRLLYKNILRELLTNYKKKELLLYGKCYQALLAGEWKETHMSSL